MAKKLTFFQADPGEIVIDSLNLPDQPIPLLADYSVFDDATAEAMKNHARRIKAKESKIGTELIDIGAELTAAKERVTHGQWLNWLHDELQRNEDAAQRVMTVYREFHDQREIASLFNPRVLELMAGRKTPASAKKALIDKAQADGHSPTAREAQGIIQQHKQPNTATLRYLGETKSSTTGGKTTQSTTNQTQTNKQETHTMTVFAPAPAQPWALQNLILEWLPDYQRTDKRLGTIILTDLHTHKPPPWPSLDDYLTKKLITYTEYDLGRALNDTLAALRQQENPAHTTLPRQIGLTEAIELITASLRSQVTKFSEDDPAALLQVLLACTVATDYTERLPPSLTLGNQIFQQAWHYVKAKLQETLPDYVPEPPPINLVAITLTLTLSEDRLTLLKTHLRNGTPGRIPLDLIAELYDQISKQT